VLPCCNLQFVHLNNYQYVCSRTYLHLSTLFLHVSDLRQACRCPVFPTAQSASELQHSRLQQTAVLAGRCTPAVLAGRFAAWRRWAKGATKASDSRPRFCPALRLQVYHSILRHTQSSYWQQKERMRTNTGRDEVRGTGLEVHDHLASFHSRCAAPSRPGHSEERAACSSEIWLHRTLATITLCAGRSRSFCDEMSLTSQSWSGTPPAPAEQQQGITNRVDARQDVYCARPPSHTSGDSVPQRPVSVCRV
jgi:hypothetical protein